MSVHFLRLFSRPY